MLKTNLTGIQYRSYIYPTLYSNPGNTPLPTVPISLGHGRHR